MNRAYNVLLVDDDNEITALLRNYLHRFGFIVATAANAPEMRKELAKGRIDLVVMDVMMPGIDGFQCAREIRQTSVMPIIMLTARTEIYDRVIGLENGADDYISKPFDPRELVARIHAVLRRTQQPESVSASDSTWRSEVICFDGWELHREERTLRNPDGMTIALSTAEFRLLCVFLQSPRRLCSRDQLLEQARGRALESFDRSIDLLVSRLRQKLGAESDRNHIIKTVRGSGYMLNVKTVHGRSTWKG